MKKLTFLLAAVTAWLVVCCGDPDSPLETVTDDYKILALNAQGNIYEIGNNTGDTENVGHIAEQDNLLIMSTVCKLGTTIYAFESTYVPAPNIMLIYNQTTGVTTTHQMVLPASLTATMNDPFITHMDYDGTKFIAIVSENQPNATHPSKIISINPQTFQATDLNINLFQQTFKSTEVMNNKLYFITSSEGFHAVDLASGSTTELLSNGNRINGTRLVQTGASTLGLLKLIPGPLNAQLSEYNLAGNTLTDKSAGNTFGIVGGGAMSKAVFHDGHYLNILFNGVVSIGLVKTDYFTNQTSFVPLDHDTITSSSTIIGITQ